MGGGKPRVQAITESLNQQRGSGYAVDDGSSIYVENHAFARCISVVWSDNQRLANLWVPRRMTDSLPRWEKILALPRTPTDDEFTRRERVQAVFSLVGVVADHATLEDRLRQKLGVVFVAIEYISLNNAVITVPDGSYPFGVVSPGAPWASTVLHMLVKTQKPDGYTEDDYYRAVGLVPGVLEPIVSAWVTFDWYRAPVVGTPINVVGGPSSAGFYLDEPNNLDNHVFDA